MEKLYIILMVLYQVKLKMKNQEQLLLKTIVVNACVCSVWSATEYGV